MKKLETLRTLTVLAVLPGSLLATAGCHKSQTFETTVEITRMSVVRKDDQGNPVTADVEISYSECPGAQLDVMRGGKEFATCLFAKHKTGDKVKVKLEHKFDPEGYYDYDVFEVDGCPRPPDPNDEASYKLNRECHDWTVNGAKVGFECKHTDKEALTAKSPWFKKH